MTPKHIAEEKAWAPFTEGEVKRLNEWQTCGWVHPFTCCADMIATTAGMECPKCLRIQTWVHDFMVLGAPENPWPLSENKPPATKEGGDDKMDMPNYAKREVTGTLTSAADVQAEGRATTPEAALSDDEIVKRICDFVGIKYEKCTCSEVGVLRDSEKGGHVPDFVNDLNAMHEAEKCLLPAQWESYLEWLGYCGENNPSNIFEKLVNTPAGEKAIALIRTIGERKEV